MNVKGYSAPIIKIFLFGDANVSVTQSALDPNVESWAEGTSPAEVLQARVLKWRELLEYKE